MYSYLKNLSKVTIFLHWLVAIVILGLIIIGIYMTNTQTFSLYGIHKSIGIIALLFITVRIFVRITEGWPQAINKKNSEFYLARVVQFTLLISTLIMPISGMIGSVFSGRGLQIFGWQLVTAGSTEKNKFIAGLAHSVHEYVGYLMIVCILLHIAGALKHHFIDKDNTLRRIFGLKFKSNK